MLRRGGAAPNSVCVAHRARARVWVGVVCGVVGVHALGRGAGVKTVFTRCASTGQRGQLSYRITSRARVCERTHA